MVATAVRQAVAKARLVVVLNSMTITSIGRLPRAANVPKAFLFRANRCGKKWTTRRLQHPEIPIGNTAAAASGK
jgi:hypothetical protein